MRVNFEMLQYRVSKIVKTTYINMKQIENYNVTDYAEFLRLSYRWTRHFLNI